MTHVGSVNTGRPFTARFHSDCDVCQGKVSPGDEAVFFDGEVVHFTCSDRQPEKLTNDFDDDEDPGDDNSRLICDSCFLELPVTGICGVCA